MSVEINEKKESKIVELLGKIQPDEKEKQSLKDIHSLIIQDFTEDIWDRIGNSAKSYIVTSLYSYAHLVKVGEENYEKIDFGGVISLALRALEFEIKKRFCYRYIEFLDKNYSSIQDFAKTNGLKNSYKAARLRKSIVFSEETGEVDDQGKKKYEYSYLLGENEHYTLGSVSRSVGYVDGGKLVSIDKTFVEFCKDVLLDANRIRKILLGDATPNLGDDEIIKAWIIDVCTRTEMVRNIRNDSSHGGIVLGQDIAKGVLDDILLIRKLLIDLVYSCKE